MKAGQVNQKLAAALELIARRNLLVPPAASEMQLYAAIERGGYRYFKQKQRWTKIELSKKQIGKLRS